MSAPEESSLPSNRHFPQDYEGLRVIEGVASFIVAKKWKTKSSTMYSSVSSLLLPRPLPPSIVLADCV